jgi:hypothetical protein
MPDDENQPRNPENNNRAENEDMAPETDYNSRVRAQLSYIVIAGFVVTVIVVLLLNYFALGNFQDPTQAPSVETVATIYSGITGAILGYWFGKGT